jgi:hypothetical protein
MKRGDIVRAPWRFYGDDPDLTGEVTRVRKVKRGHDTLTEVTVRWHDNGTVTLEGDESVFVGAAQIISLTSEVACN